MKGYPPLSDRVRQILERRRAEQVAQSVLQRRTTRDFAFRPNHGQGMRKYPRAKVGDVFGCMTVIELLTHGRGRERVRARCECGFEREHFVWALRNQARHGIFVRCRHRRERKSA